MKGERCVSSSLHIDISKLTLHSNQLLDMIKIAELMCLTAAMHQILNATSCLSKLPIKLVYVVIKCLAHNLAFVADNHCDPMNGERAT